MEGMRQLIDDLWGSPNSIETAEAMSVVKGLTISGISIDSTRGDKLVFEFKGTPTKLEVWDDGQNCCEYRHIEPDIDLENFVGSKLLDISSMRAGNIDDEEDAWKVIEVCFLHVTTSAGKFVCSNYNEHNGYYGGFSIRARLV